MLVAPSQNSPIPAPPTGTSAGDTTPKKTVANARSSTPAPEAKPAPPAAEPSVTVDLSTPHDRSPISAPPPIYAEVWKNGVKVATVDRDGSVNSLLGPVAPPLGGAVGGPLFAAVRAAQVAQSVGGEIRINGLTIDAGTLRTRIHLENAYGR